jgi:hypothetical protein
MRTTSVRYQYRCPDHGDIGSAPISKRDAPAFRNCPVCAQDAEVWVGSTRAPVRTPGVDATISVGA